MATPLDLGLIDKFSIIFPFLLSVTVVYGLLTYTKMFGENKSIHVLIAGVVGLMLLISPTVREVINTMAPWFVLLFLFFFFLILAFKIFGTTDSEIMDVLKSPKYSYTVIWIIALVLIIAVGSLSSVTFKEGAPKGVNETESARDTEASGAGTNAFWNTLFHPKVLGLALIFLIASFTVSRLMATPIV